MSTIALAYVGGFMMAVATLPQAIKMLRTRSAGDIGWSFAWLNFAGISLLGVRALAIQEWPFLAINVVTALFWALVIAIKLSHPLRDARAKTSATR